jgi:dimethylhistidine N-methyltransferase
MNSPDGHGATAPDALAFFIDLEPPAGDFRSDVLEGLAKPQKTISPKHFYDERGSQLFDEITRAPEYYVTKTERGILERAAPGTAKIVGPNAAVLELGSGSSVKIRTLLDALDKPALYAALDISRDHLLASAAGLSADYPDVKVGAICADFTQPLELPEDLFAGAGRRLVFFPGSTIGNFDPDAAENVLRTARGLLRRGDFMLIGFDLKKRAEILERAYDDAGGVTAAFNRNLLTRINAELGGTIDVDAFEHRAVYNADKGRVEMHLVATSDTEFEVAGRRFAMKRGETIHTENSHKFEGGEFDALAARAAFAPVESWTDADGLFCVRLYEAA